ncbi:MAG: hypothetical protein J0M34_09260 [Alphaproteobacteria bacterium]|nr:hypothetical protein [Alphaproteobacteria bacterium]
MTSQDVVPKELMDGLRKRLDEVLRLSQNSFGFSELDKALRCKHPSAYWRHDNPEVMECLEELSVMYAQASLAIGYRAAPLAKDIRQSLSDAIACHNPQPLIHANANDFVSEVEGWVTILKELNEVASKSFVGPRGHLIERTPRLRAEALEQAARSITSQHRE